MQASNRRSSGAFLLELLFDLPLEKWLSWSRLLLAAISLVGTAFDTSLTPDALQATRIILFGYLWYAAFLVLAAPKHGLKPRFRLIVHALDIMVSSGLMYLTEGPTSPFYVFFIYIIMAGALRWDWQGALATAALLACILFVLFVVGAEAGLPGMESTDQDLSRALVRGGFLLICGGLLGYIGAFLARSRLRFARLAAWPSAQPARTAKPFAALLGHAAEVLGALRVLVIWEQEDEPFRHTLLWSEGKVRASRERAELFGTLVAPAYTTRSFVAGVDPERAFPNPKPASLIDADIVRTFNITTLITAPFARERCAGRIFVLDREIWTEDDVPLVEIIASRIGIEIEENILRDQLGATAATRERNRVARDLHDGVLQGLAAASIQMKILSRDLPGSAQDELNRIRGLLSEEAKRIRAFVEESRSGPAAAPGVVQLAPELEARVQSLRVQWRRQIDLKLDPVDIRTSISVARDVCHLITEAVSNAVRHGDATHITITVERSESRLRVRILDDGTGFATLTGSFSHRELEERSAGPLSLRTRVDDIGGSLFLSSSPHGSQITIELAA